MTDFRIRRLAYALGAEVTGVDLQKPLVSALVSRLRSEWLKYLLLVFPNQDLNNEQLLVFTQQFSERRLVGSGSLPFRNGEMTARLAGQWDGYKDGHNWHTDKSFTTRPTTATILLCRTIPPIGGDTMFANMYMAYETLSAAMKERLDGMSAVHVRELSLRPMYQRMGDRDRIRDQIQLIEMSHAATREAAVHSAVRVHPETNKKALFLGTRVRKFVGMSDEESRLLLDFLNSHAVSYEFTYRHKYTANDLVIWDNRCLQHIALCDYDVENDVRHFERCVIPGPELGTVFVPDW